MKFKQLFASTLLLFTSFFFLVEHNLHAAPIGKIDIAPAYIHIDVIALKKTVKELDMAGIRADVSYVTERGWLFKPTILYGRESEGNFASYSFSFGRCIPIKERWIVTPSVGISYTDMEAIIHLDLGVLGKVKFKDRFKALAPFLAIEAIYNFEETWRLCASVQYAWSHSKTSFSDLLSSKSDAQGPNYGLLVEHDFNKQWSMNLGVGYNESFSQERNGLRARGIKLGIVRWF